jgi:hypothetical protein
MRGLRFVVSRAVLFALVAAAAPSGAQAPATTPSDRPRKSVYGKLESLDPKLNTAVMRSDAGELLSWRFEPKVVAELKRFQPGDPMIVIYRQVTTVEKRVTAVAFPGAAAKPTYLNLTGERISVRSSPGANDACEAPGDPVSEVTIPDGGMAEVLERCWCCTSAGQTCTPNSKSGNGRAVLVSCFQ